MENSQAQPTSGIRDPVLRKMAEDFNKQSLTIAAYHLLHIRQAVIDHAVAARQAQQVPPVAAPPAAARRSPNCSLMAACKQANGSCVKCSLRRCKTSRSNRCPMSIK